MPAGPRQFLEGRFDQISAELAALFSESRELARREFSQWPLDRKKDLADYVISNTADAGFVRDQVKDVLSRILAKCEQRA